MPFQSNIFRIFDTVLSQVTDLRVSCEMVEKKARETRQAEEKVDIYYIMVMLLTENNFLNMGFNNMSNNDDDNSNIQAHAEEIDHLRKTSQQLKSQLEGILHKK